MYDIFYVGGVMKDVNLEFKLDISDNKVKSVALLASLQLLVSIMMLLPSFTCWHLKKKYLCLEFKLEMLANTFKSAISLSQLGVSSIMFFC